MVDRATVSPDGMKYTFTLRDDLRWHDGQPVLSEDCVDALKRRERRIASANSSWRIRGRSRPLTRRRSRAIAALTGVHLRHTPFTPEHVTKSLR
jgi:hypothetical protein